MSRPITIQVDGTFKDTGKQHAEIECDDYITIFSKVNGATFDPEGKKEPSLTREVGISTANFKDITDVYNRLTQGTVQIFKASDNEKVNDYNLINFICTLIKYGGLSNKVHLTVNEECLANAGKMPAPTENAKGDK